MAAQSRRTLHVTLIPAEEGGFTVQCVELPAAISQGDTRDEALVNIREAIELILEGGAATLTEVGTVDVSLPAA